MLDYSHMHINIFIDLFVANQIKNINIFKALIYDLHSNFMQL